jgi:DNA-binding response OmpR family regulator
LNGGHRQRRRDLNALLVEDAPEIVESITLCVSLRWPHIAVNSTSQGEEGIRLALTEAPDIVILDVGLPDMEGFDVLREIRAHSDVPVAIVTVRGDEMSKVKGLELGADDYIVKPFSHTELLARINALLRRSHMPRVRQNGGIVTGTGLHIDLAGRRVFVNAHEVELTSMEWNLLSYLVRNEGRIIPHEVLAERVWCTQYIGRSAIKMCIRRLRGKLSDPGGSPVTIRSHRGRGYSLGIAR